MIDTAVNARHCAARKMPSARCRKEGGREFLRALPIQLQDQTDVGKGYEREAVVSSRAAHAMPELQADETRD